MNRRRMAFCEAYLVSGNATEAAIKAGYSPKTARSIGQRLLTFVDVKEYLDRRNQGICDVNTAKIEEIRVFWTTIMRDTKNRVPDRLKASELLAKTYGAFSEHVVGEMSITETVEAWIESIPDVPGKTADDEK